MRVLVTGGSGYIGSVSVEALVAAGHEVVVLDNLSTGHAGAVPRGVRLDTGDYQDGDHVEALLRNERIDAVLHCAARSLVGESIVDPASYYRQNVAGGIALLEAIRRADVRRVVFSSTAAVYGLPDRTPITEDDPVRPINPYGETKRTFEGALRWYGNAYGLRSVSLRYFNAAGASTQNGESHDPETHLIPNILLAAERGMELTLFGDDYPTPDGTCVRDYVHVLDLADAHLRALTATASDDARTGPAEGAVAPLVCNLGSGAEFSNRDVHRAAEHVVGHPIPLRVGPRRAGDPPTLLASGERARAILGWTPAHGTLEEMIGSAWAWRRNHPAGYAG